MDDIDVLLIACRRLLTAVDYNDAIETAVHKDASATGALRDIRTTVERIARTRRASASPSPPLREVRAS